jgi:hypothetical protein
LLDNQLLDGIYLHYGMLLSTVRPGIDGMASDGFEFVALLAVLFGAGVSPGAAAALPLSEHSELTGQAYTLRQVPFLKTLFVDCLFRQDENCFYY